MKACRSLLAAVYFAPEQIRTCCKRYHYANQLKGDAVLFDNGNQCDISSLTLLDVIDRKKEIIREINSDKFDASHQCFGCPWLDDFEDNEAISLDHISFEMHSVCNMRCTYCSDVYYGGKSSPYDTDSLLSDLAHHINSRPSASNLSIVFGGGEPVLFNDFSKLLEFSIKYTSDIVVFTNSTIYNQYIQAGIDSEKISIITSIDAGNSALFKQIRGLDAFDKVLANLSKYSAHNPSRVTIKYIFTDGNSSVEEVELFLSSIQKYHLSKCNFQISSDFKSSYLKPDQVNSINELRHRLKADFNSTVFVDDHLAPRLIASSGYENIDSSEQYVVWGCGEHSRRIFERVGVKNVKYFIDRDPSISGFMGLEVRRPSALMQAGHAENIFIASVYFYNTVYKEIQGMNLNHSVIPDPY